MSSITLVILMLLLSAFFSGLEIAFISVNKLRIELKSNQGKHWAKLCSNYIKSPSKFISTILVGNNIALVVYGVTMEEPGISKLVSVSLNGSGDNGDGLRQSGPAGDSGSEWTGPIPEPGETLIEPHLRA